MKNEVPHRRYGRVIVFYPDDRAERYSMPDPNDEALNESLHRLRYNFANATQADAFRVLAAAEAYQHFAAHPAPTRMLIKQLRELRRVVRTTQRENT